MTFEIDSSERATRIRRTLNVRFRLGTHREEPPMEKFVALVQLIVSVSALITLVVLAVAMMKLFS